MGNTPCSLQLGQCGAPIVEKHKNTVIGTHCHGGDGYGNNAGNPICGPYGHDYYAFANIFDHQKASFGTSDHIQVVDIHGSDSRTMTPAISSNDQFSSPQHRAILTTPTMPATSAAISAWGGTPEIADAGSFFNVLHNVAQVDSTVDASLSCLLGPLSGLSSAAAGALLASVCRVAMSVGCFANMDGISERALAAEAALQAVLRLEPSPERGEVIQKMQINWSANAPSLEGIASRLALALTQCALDIAVHRLSKTSDPRRRREGYVSFLPQRRHLEVGGGLSEPPRKRCLLGKGVRLLKAYSNLPWSLLGRRNFLGGSNPSWRGLSRMRHPSFLKLRDPPLLALPPSYSGTRDSFLLSRSAIKTQRLSYSIVL